MITHVCLNKTITSLKTLLLLMALGLVLVAILPVSAKSWTVKGQGDCYAGYPRADNWISWEGYSSSTTGSSSNTLWYYNGGWIKKSRGYGEYTGPSGSAIAKASSAYQRGSWVSTGTHYLNGVKMSGSESNVFTCQ